MSNIKFYPTNIATITLNDPTTSSSDHPKTNMLDYRLATYWQADDTTDPHYIPFDFGTSTSCQYVLFYADLDDGDLVEIYADSNSDYSTEAKRGEKSITSTGWQWVLVEFAAYSLRYWRIKLDLSGSPTVPSISTIFLGTSYEITIRYNYGQIIEPTYRGVKLIESYGGQRGATQKSPPRNTWQFKYEDLDSTNKGYLDSIMAICNGWQYPLYFVDTDGNGHYVRMMINKLNATEKTHLLYDVPNIILEEELGSPA